MAPAASKTIRAQLRKLRFRVVYFGSDGVATSPHSPTVLSWEELSDFCMQPDCGPELRLMLATAHLRSCDLSPEVLPLILDAVDGLAPLPYLSTVAPLFPHDLLPKARRERARCALRWSVPFSTSAR